MQWRLFYLSRERLIHFRYSGGGNTRIRKNETIPEWRGIPNPVQPGCVGGVLNGRGRCNRRPPNQKLNSFLIVLDAQ